jgi:hypothetical protein
VVGAVFDFKVYSSHPASLFTLGVVLRRIESAA